MSLRLVSLSILLVLGAGCASSGHGGQGASPSSTASTTAKCGRRPLLCANGFEQCVTDRSGCETCTCTSAGGYNNLDPRMPP